MTVKLQKLYKNPLITFLVDVNGPSTNFIAFRALSFMNFHNFLKREKNSGNTDFRYMFEYVRQKGIGDSGVKSFFSGRYMILLIRKKTF